MANEPIKNAGQGGQQDQGQGQGQGAQAPSRNPQDDQAADKRESGMGGKQGGQGGQDRQNMNDQDVE